MNRAREEDGAEERPWRRGLLAVSMFLCVAAYGFLEPFVPLYLELSGISRSQIGLVSGVGTALALLIQPLIGRLSDRIDARRPLMLLAAFTAAGAYLSFRWSNGLLGFVLLTALGVNGVMYLNTANAVLVGRMASRMGNRGACGGTFAAYRIWGSVGYVTVSLLCGLLLSRSLTGAGMTRETIAPVFLYGPLLFLLVAAVVVLLPDPKSGVERARSTQAPAEKLVSRPGHARTLDHFLKAYFLYVFAYTGCGAYISLYLKSLGATPAWITLVFASGVICEVLVMSQVGRLSDQFGRRPVLALAFLFMPVRLALYPLATNPAGVLAVQLIHGINFGVMAAVAVTFVSDLCSECHRGAMQSRLAATSGIAAAIGPAVGGWIAQRYGIHWTFGTMACVAASGAAIFLWKVRETHPSRTPLHRVGPARLRPILGMLSVPMVRLARKPRA